MTAQRTGTPLVPRLFDFFRRLLGRHTTPEQPAAGTAVQASHTSPAGSDFGPLATAQYVHDLRNLLNIIAVCAECMAERLPDGAAEWEYNELRRATERAATLTRELLLSARPGAAGRGRVDVNNVITSAADTMARLVGETIRVTLRLSQEPAMVIADAGELDRILLNLALNARDAMTDGGALTIETAVLPVSAAQPPIDRSPAVVRLRVSDSGSGMSPEVKARIFEPFFTTKPAGTGLGLSSVAFTVQQLGGTIAVESQPRVGTRVTIQLPLAAAPEWPVPSSFPPRAA
jgi:signal transduction histidine kinase